MRTLVFDTSSSAIVVGFAHVDLKTRTFEIQSQEVAINQSRQSERLLPTIDLVLQNAGRKIEEVEGLVVGLGPGSFTGLRIGIATAKTMGMFSSVKIVGVSSQMAYVPSNFENTSQVRVVVNPATRTDCYLTAFRGTELVEAAIPISEVANFLKPHFSSPFDFFSSSAELLVAVGAPKAVVSQISVPSLIKLGIEKFVTKQILSYQDLHPLYVKPPSARPQIGLFNSV